MRWKDQFLMHPNIARLLMPKFRFIADLPGGARVLDLGCCTGGTIKQCMKMQPSVRAYAADIRDVQHYLPANVSFSQFDASVDPFPYENNFFDAVFCCQVIEHIPAPHTHLFQEIFRVLRPGGGLYINTPSPRWLFAPSLMGGIGTNFLDDPSHVSLFTTTKLHCSLVDCGFEVNRIGIERNLGYLMLSPVILPLGLLVGNRPWIVLGMQHLFGLSIYAIARKPSIPKARGGWIGET